MGDLKLKAKPEPVEMCQHYEVRKDSVDKGRIYLCTNYCKACGKQIGNSWIEEKPDGSI